MKFQYSPVRYSHHAVQLNCRTYSPRINETVYPCPISPHVSHPQALVTTTALCFNDSDYVRFHLQMRSCSICLFVSGWFHLAYCPPGSSLWLQISRGFLMQHFYCTCLSPKPNRNPYSSRRVPRASGKVSCISSPHSLKYPFDYWVNL